VPHHNAAASKVVVALLVISLLGIPPAGGSEGDPVESPPEPIGLVGSPGMFMDEFDDDRNVTLEGNAVVKDGNLTLDVPVLFEDDFSDPGSTLWTLTEGTGMIDGGRLEVSSTTSANTTISRSLDHHDVRITVSINFTTFDQGGPYVGLVFPDMELRIIYDDVAREVRWEVHGPGSEMSVIDDYTSSLTEGEDIAFTLCVKDDEPILAFPYKHWPYSFDRTGNVTAIILGCWGGAEGSYDDLVVEDLGATGVALSRAVELPDGCLWDEAYFTDLWRYAEEVGNVDIVDAATGEVIPPYKDVDNFQSPLDIQDIHFLDHPSIKLRARFWLEGTAMPYLRNWSLSWRVGGLLWMDSFDDLSRCTTNGTEQYWSGDRPDWVMKKYGAVNVNHTVWVDEFEGTQESPWSAYSSSGEGSVRVEDGYLWIEGPDTAGERTGVEWDFDVPGLFLYFDFFVDTNGPGGFELRISTESGKAFILRKDVGTELLWLVWDGHEEHVIYDIGRFWMGSWYRNGEIRIGQDGDLHFGGGGGYAGLYHYFGEDFTRVQFSCGQGFDLHVNRMMLERYRLSGNVVSETVVLPEGMMWTKAVVAASLDTARLDVLDASTLLPVPGYEGLSSSDLVKDGWPYVLDIRGIDPERHPGLRLRYDIHSFNINSPKLFFWQLWWEPGSNVIMDAFDDGSGVEWTEDMGVADGRLTTPNILTEDDFTRYDISPWSVEEGVVDTLAGALWTQSREGQPSAAALDIPDTDPLGLSLRCFTYRYDEIGPGIELRGEDGRSYTIRYDPVNEQIHLLYDNNIRETDVWVRNYFWDDNDWVAIEIIFDSPTMVLLIGGDTFTIPILNSFIIDTLVLHSGDSRKVYWDDLVISRHTVTGSAITDHITLPTGEGWLWLEVEHGAPGNSSLAMSLVDAESGVAIPGFETMMATLYDIGSIDNGDHPVVQLKFDFSGEYMDVPYVDWYRIYWTGMVDSIVQTREFEAIEVMEDTPVTDVLNVTDYFTSTFTDPLDLEYEITDISDPSIVLPRLDGLMLAIDLPEENWWGAISFRIKVSKGDLNFKTDPITVIVIPVDDPPVFQDVDIVIVTEDEVKEVHLWGWLFYDVDTEFVDLVVEVPDGNATVDGYAIELLFETGGFERDLPVIVSDGTTTVEGSLSVRVLSVDDAPIIAYIGKQYIPEDEVYTLDLAPYIIDEDTPLGDLIVSIEEPNCTVNGLLLTFYYGNAPEGSMDLRLIMTVSDGTSSVDATLRVLVMDIPDITFAPEVKEVPTQLFRVGEESTMDFSPYVTDMDTPLEDLTIDCDHPDVVSCQGLTVTFRFSETTENPVDIPFNVSDSTSTVPASFKVLVSEDSGEDPEPAMWWTGGGGILLLIVIVVTVVAVVAYLGKRAD